MIPRTPVFFYRLAAFSACISAAAFLTAAVRAAPVINEIHFRPGSGYPENTALEFIEVYNPDPGPVDMSGWQLTAGADFTFPAGSVIPVDGYIVVAANPAALLAAKPGLTGIAGQWAAGARLSNNGERIRLARPDAEAPGELITVDDVRYSDEGDWAQRTRETRYGGWAWTSGASSGGRTLELRNPWLPNDNGQNWAVSAAAGGTPGARNSVWTDNGAPLVGNVTHHPAVPRPGESVRVSCVIDDETPAAVAATLRWRDATAETAGNFTSIPMSAGPGGSFTATIPPGTHLKVVEFYISATDQSATRTWPAATSEGQNANCLFQFDNEAADPDDPVYRMILTGRENAEFEAVPDSSDRMFNVTFIATRGPETTIRYGASMRLRGNSSRGLSIRPMRISLPADHPWDGVTDFNLNPKFPWLQHLGMRMFQTAGLPAADTIAVEVRRNGVEYAGGPDTEDLGKWVRVEDYNGQFADRHWPAASGGNIYKKGRPDEFWRSTSAAPSNPDNTLDGWSKQNNSAANDWSDLTGFFTVWQNAAAFHFTGFPTGDVDAGTWRGTAFTSEQVAGLRNVADLAQWARFFALMTLLEDGETNISNGQDDDYTIYFRPADGRRQALLLPHDLDTILGRGDHGAIASPTARGLYDATAEGSVFKPLLPLMGNSVTSGEAEFRSAYFTAIRELSGGVLNADTAGHPNPPFYQLVDHVLGNWVDAARRTAIKNFMTQRQTHLLGLTGGGRIAPVAPAALSTLAGLTAPVVLNEILPVNVSAHPANGVYPDIIELRNTTGSGADISGFGLSDDLNIPGKFVFPAGTVIAAGGTLVVYADDAFSTPGLYTGFRLGSGGATLRLSTPDGTRSDEVTFGPVPPDFSIGRNAGGTWVLCTPTAGTAVNTPAALGSLGAVCINEWAGNAGFRIADDFLELYNPGTSPVALGGSRLTDDPANYPARHLLPPLSFIGPRGFLKFTAAGDSATPGDFLEMPFKIDASFGTLTFSGANGAPVDSVTVLSQFDGESAGRGPDGAAAITVFGRAAADGTVTAAAPTPGASNGPLPANLTALLNHLRLTEFNYKPRSGNDYEFVELYNTGTTALDLSGVRFTNGIDYVFPPGVALGAGEFTVICRNRAAFSALYPDAVPRLAPGAFTGALDNSGETLAFSLPNPWDLEILSFSWEPRWHPQAASQGHSLTLIAPVATRLVDWGRPEMWVASAAPGGTPGVFGPPIITSALTLSGVQGSALSYQISAANAPASYAASGLPAGLSIDPATGFISGVPAGTGEFNVAISATSSAGTDTRTLVLTLSPMPPPVITSVLAVNAVISAPFTYQITAAGEPGTFSATGLPGWLTFNAAAGRLTGAPPALGTSTVTIAAANAGGTDTRTLTINIVADPLAAALDGAGLSWRTGGNLPWIQVTAGARDGTGAARSGAITHNQESWMETTVIGPDRVSFWWKVESEARYDFLRLTMDGVQVREIDGNQDWTRVTQEVPAGSHVLRWVYLKDTVVSTGADAGWVDGVMLASQSVVPEITSNSAVTAVQGAFFSYQITATLTPQTFTAAPLPAGLSMSAAGLISGVPEASGAHTVAISATGAAGTATGVVVINVSSSPAELAEAGDGKGLTWAHSNVPGNVDWFRQIQTTSDGVDALRAGPVAGTGNSAVSFTVTGPGSVEFWWKISSNLFNDLVCELDGQSQALLFGQTGWELCTVPVPAGPHTVTVRYVRKNSDTAGEDTAWIDEVVFRPVDSEPDGLADAWETAHFGNLAQTATDDTDHDGFSNLNEQDFRTDPKSAESKCEITAVKAHADGSVTLDWSAVPGGIYAIEWSADMVAWNTAGTIYADRPQMSRTFVRPLRILRLVADNANVRAFIPTADTGTLWRGGDEPAFLAAGGDTSWLSGRQPAGFENDVQQSNTNVPFNKIISLDLKARMSTASPQRSCAYLRIPFNVADPASLEDLALEMRFEDGFAAFINGVPVAADNTAASPAWNATTTSRPENDAVTPKTFDLTASRNLLRSGTNILAIHGVNASAGSSDFLLQAQLLAREPAPAGTKVYWRITAH